MQRRDTLWQQREPDDCVTWHPMEPARAVEGPLALDFFVDQTLVLELAPHQLAFREEAGQLKQVYFDGLHELAVGDGNGQISPESRLFFLRGDVPLTWRWSEETSLRVDTGRGTSNLIPLRGACSVVIDDPAGFHRKVLQGLESLEPEVLVGVLDTLVRTQIEARIEALVENQSVDTMRVQILLNDLAAADLDDDLLEIGLRCIHLAAGTPAAREEAVAPQATYAAPVGSYDDVF